MKKYAFLAATLLVSASAALAQGGGGGLNFFDDPPARTKPDWEQFKLNPKATVRLDFRNANVDAVIKLLSEASGIPIVKDPSLTGGLTLQSPKQQNLTDAFAMFNAVLGLKNYDLKKEGNFLVIRSRGGGGGRGNRGNGIPGGFNFPTNFPGTGSQSPQLKVYAIKFANASQVARVINEVFADSGNNLLQQMQMMNGFGAGGTGFPGAGGGVPGGGGPPAGPAAPAAQSSSAGTATGAAGGGVQVAQGGGGGGFGGGGRGGNNRGGGFGGFGGGGNNPGGFGGFNRNFGGGRGGPSIVKASADDFSNSVIVNAPLREQGEVANLIDDLDKQTEQPQQSRVFKLEYAVSTDLAPVIQNVLVSNAPRGRGGIGSQNVPIDQRFQAAARFGSGQAAFGSVIADARTNSVVVTGTSENLDLVGKVVKELDKPVQFESSSFVVTLDNARADQLADVINQSFGGRTGTNTTRRTTGTTTGTQSRTNANRSNSPSQLGGRGGPNNENEVALDMQDPDAQSGELATRVQVAQNFGGFGGGFGGGGFNQNQNRTNQNRNGTGTTTGLDAQGRVINVRDLTGQVVAIPDINTNSVIVVTSPENRAMLQQILQQLDKIPEQVMIETLIVEASLDATNKLGFEWSFNQNKVAGETGAKGTGTVSFGAKDTTTQPQGFRYTITGGQYSAFLTALKSDSRFEVLSTPRIFTSNNATAEINISQSLPYVTSQQTNAAGFVTFQYDFLDVGIILTVTPRITSKGFVTMEVTQTANDFVRYTDFNAPVVNQREAQTTVSVKDGETIVLGGVIRNTVSTTTNKLPILGDIPVLGKLFQSSSQQKNKTELLVFLTPRIVRDPDEAKRLREDTEKQMQSPSIKALVDERAKADKKKEELEKKAGDPTIKKDS
ncbi:MAG: secretin N-terminal domain-containing protein [Armatimonas sp.]